MIKILSKYMEMKQLMNSLRASFTRACSTAGAFFKPKGIKRYLKCSRMVLKMVFHSSPDQMVHIAQIQFGKDGDFMKGFEG